VSGIAWDSLAPITAAREEPKGGIRALEARRGRGGERRAIVMLTESPKRVAVVAGSGLWRWRFRGGVSADAFTAVWGSVFDWLATERADRRAAIPDAGAFRAGERIRWRRGAARDSMVVVALRREDDAARADSLTLRFGRSSSVVTTPPLSPGIYRVEAAGGTSRFVVNRSREWVPRSPSMRSGAAPRRAVAGLRPTVRDFGWMYVITVLLLCAEWILRRRAGMR
jgi:hypothetical protein